MTIQKPDRPFRHTLNGMVLELEAEPVAWFLEHVPDNAEALELAAAEELAARCRLHTEWRIYGTRATVKLFEGDCEVDAWGGDTPTPCEARILAAQLILTWLARGAKARRRWPASPLHLVPEGT